MLTADLSRSRDDATARHGNLGLRLASEETRQVKARSLLGCLVMHTPSSPADAIHPSPVVDLTSLIRTEYLELPALSLTVPQGARLWCVDRRSCQDAFDVLVTEGFLYRLGDSYCRTNGRRSSRH